MEDKEWQPAPVVVKDKWDGEDEEEDVKDNWDDDDEEDKSDKTPSESTSAPKPAGEGKKKKNLLKKLAEKEEKELMERLEKMEPELRAREKLLEEKRREEAELQYAKEAFGGGLQPINSSDPHTKDDFDELRKQIVADLNKFSKRPVFPDFLEDLIQDLSLNLDPRRLKKVKTMVEALYFEKTKIEKKAKGPAGKSKAKLTMDNDKAILSNLADDDYGGDLDDFM